MSAGRWRTLALLSLASLGWAFSFGLGAPLAALWLNDAGQSKQSIGLNAAIYYLGVALASPFVPWLMRRANRPCVLAGMLLDAAATAAFPWCDGPVAWHALRLAAGVGTALSLVPMETLVNHNAEPRHRARDFGIYAFCVVLGLALGAVIGVPLYPHAPRLAFALGGLVTFVAVAAVWVVVPREAPGGPVGPDASRALPPLGHALLPLGTAWAQGFLEAGALAFLSLFLLGRGHDETATGALMGALFAGVLVAQLPLAWLADRVGRMRILLGCHGLLMAGLLVLPLLEGAWQLVPALVLLGACCGALYPLGLSLLGERVPSDALATANAWYLTSNCAGSLTGPMVLGLTIHHFGLGAQFAAHALAVAAVLVVWALFSARGAGRVAPKAGQGIE